MPPTAERALVSCGACMGAHCAPTVLRIRRGRCPIGPFLRPARRRFPGAVGPNHTGCLYFSCFSKKSTQKKERKVGHPLFQPPRLSGVHAIQLRRPKPACSAPQYPLPLPGRASRPGKVHKARLTRVVQEVSLGADLCAKCRRCAAVALRKAACGPHCPHRPLWVRSRLSA